MSQLQVSPFPASSLCLIQPSFIHSPMEAELCFDTFSDITGIHLHKKLVSWDFSTSPHTKASLPCLSSIKCPSAFGSQFRQYKFSRETSLFLGRAYRFCWHRSGMALHTDLGSWGRSCAQKSWLFWGFNLFPPKDWIFLNCCNSWTVVGCWKLFCRHQKAWLP